MISEAIVSLKDSHGSLRQAVLKYLQEHYSLTNHGFRALFNNALRKGVEQGRFKQPRGPLGPILLVNKKTPSKSKGATAPKRPRSSSMSKASKPQRPQRSQPAATPRRALTGKIRDQSKLTEAVKTKKSSGTKTASSKSATAKTQTKNATAKTQAKSQAKSTKATAKTAKPKAKSTTKSTTKAKTAPKSKGSSVRRLSRLS